MRLLEPLYAGVEEQVRREHELTLLVDLRTSFEERFVRLLEAELRSESCRSRSWLRCMSCAIRSA